MVDHFQLVGYEVNDARAGNAVVLPAQNDITLFSDTRSANIILAALSMTIGIDMTGEHTSMT